jgi:transcriptional regulator with XRE-family HTH domain
MSFPENLIARRNHQGLTQDQLAGRAGISPRSVASYEAGDTDPTLPALLALAKALNCSTSFLLGETDSPLVKTPYSLHNFTCVGKSQSEDIRVVIDDLGAVQKKNKIAWNALRTIIAELAHHHKRKPPTSDSAEVGIEGPIKIVGDWERSRTVSDQKPKPTDEQHQ